MSLKDKFFEKSEEERDLHLANVLGIAVEELRETDFEIKDAEQNEEGVIMGYVLKFGMDTPMNILAKIEGIKGHEIRLDPSAL